METEVLLTLKLSQIKSRIILNKKAIKALKNLVENYGSKHDYIIPVIKDLEKELLFLRKRKRLREAFDY